MHLKTFEHPRIPFVSENPPPPGLIGYFCGLCFTHFGLLFFVEHPFEVVGKSPLLLLLLLLFFPSQVIPSSPAISKGFLGLSNWSNRHTFYHRVLWAPKTPILRTVCFLTPALQYWYSSPRKIVHRNYLSIEHVEYWPLKRETFKTLKPSTTWKFDRTKVKHIENIIASSVLSLCLTHV